LIENTTKFPTVVIPHGNDGSNNHAIVVVDDIIFDTTQVYALRLCRESLDWICGEKGMASIDIAIRFNRGHRTKRKLEREKQKNW
jgi:pyrimidine operon attenuation protein/uracil phosphoribosyltransferase